MARMEKFNQEPYDAVVPPDILSGVLRAQLLGHKVIGFDDPELRDSYYFGPPDEDGGLARLNPTPNQPGGGDVRQLV